MGGLAGRADALFGAVECQKSGCLHFHFFTFVQRLHQFATMQEIARMLEEKLVDSIELKQFLENLCCACYADLGKHRAEVEKLERDWPTYSESTECASKDKPQWDEIELGRLHAFLYDDAKTHAVQGAPTSHPVPPGESPVMDAMDGATYKQKFDAAFQYFQSRCQHHVHKLINCKRGSQRMPLQVQADRVQA